MKPTQEQVMQWAREAGLHIATDVHWMPIIGLKYIERATTLAYEAGRLAENEACAKVAENRWLNKANCTAEEMYEMQKKNIADAIRARGQE